MIDHMITLLDPMVCQATDFRRCFVEHRTAVFVEVKFYISPATWQAKLHRTLLKLMFWQLTRSIAGARTTTEQPSVALWSTSSLDLSYLHCLLNTNHGTIYWNHITPGSEVSSFWPTQQWSTSAAFSDEQRKKIFLIAFSLAVHAHLLWISSHHSSIVPRSTTWAQQITSTFLKNHPIGQPFRRSLYIYIYNNNSI